jgi:hypothetical protein
LVFETDTPDIGIVVENFETTRLEEFGGVSQSAQMDSCKDKGVFFRCGEVHGRVLKTQEETIDMLDSFVSTELIITNRIF